MIELSIIIVNYNTVETLKKCISSINEYLQDIKYEIIIVDNHSTDGSQKILEDNYPEISFIQLIENMGYSYANNQGIEVSNGKFLLFLNPDTYFIDNSMKHLLEFMNNIPTCGAVGPLIVDEKGKMQTSSFCFPDIKQQILYSFHYSAQLRKEGVSVKQKKCITKAIPFEVDWLSGACLLVRKSIIIEYGRFDENYHLYGEDVDLCKNIKHAGWNIYCIPNANIVHIGGIVSHKDPLSFITNRYRSNLIYARKHFSFYQVFYLRFIVIMGLLMRIIGIYFVRSSSITKKTQRIKAYCQSILLWLGIASLHNKYLR